MQHVPTTDTNVLNTGRKKTNDLVSTTSWRAALFRQDTGEHNDSLRLFECCQPHEVLSSLKIPHTDNTHRQQTPRLHEITEDNLSNSRFLRFGTKSCFDSHLQLCQFFFTDTDIHAMLKVDLICDSVPRILSLTFSLRPEFRTHQETPSSTENQECVQKKPTHVCTQQSSNVLDMSTKKKNTAQHIHFTFASDFDQSQEVPVFCIHLSRNQHRT